MAMGTDTGERPRRQPQVGPQDPGIEATMPRHKLIA